MAKTWKNLSKDEVLSYKHPELIARFCSIYSITEEEAEEVFDILKLWLWLGHEKVFEDQSPDIQSTAFSSMIIDSPLLIMDEMWHNFILFTKDYFEFCLKYFGYYIHHSPGTMKEQESARKRLENMTESQRIEAEMDRKRSQYTYTYDKLGEMVFKKMYIEYPEKYNHKSLILLQIKKQFPDSSIELI